MSKKKNPTVVRELTPSDHNPRSISDARSAQLAKSMKKFGDLSSVTFNRRTGRLVSGHQRVKHLKSDAKIQKHKDADKVGTVAVGLILSGNQTWPYREVDWDDKTEKAACIAANAAGGQFDDMKLGKLVMELDGAGFDLDLLNLDSLEDILKENSEPPTEEDDVPEPPKKPVTKPGDIWILGDHRLLCGDARKSEDVARLMAGKKAVMVFTDPPYGVEYEGKTKKALTIKNDGASGLADLLRLSFSALDSEGIMPGAAIYVAHPPGALALTFDNAFVAQDWRLHETIIWVKDSMVLGHSDYHFKHEPITFGYKLGDGRHGRGGKGWYGPDNETSIIEVPRPKRSEEHPTMKPVELIARFVRNSSPRGGVVLDSFGGSGSTLIACETTKRKCRMMELDPIYCDVICDRYFNLTGKKAKLE